MVEAKKKSIWKRWYMIVLYVFIGFMIIGAFLPDVENDNSNQENPALTDNSNIQNSEELTDEKKESSTSTRSVGIGEEGRIYLEDSNSVAVCKTKDYMKELVDTAVKKDKIGWENMFYEGKCYLASTLDDFGKVLVLDRTFTLVEFRFVNSESVHYRKKAWTNVEYVIPLEQ